MRKLTGGLAALVLGGGLVASTGGAALAAPDTGVPPLGQATAAPVVEDLPNPLEDKRRALRETAVTGVLDGELEPQEIGGRTVVKVGEEAAAAAPGATARGRAGSVTPEDQYVELERESTDPVFVLLVEFGDQRSPDFPDVDSDPNKPGPQRFDGPLHNQIPEPDRSVDNSTVWQEDFSSDYYQDLYFGEGDGVESLKTYYETQSSGRYSVDGQVSDWVKVPFNEARYGRNPTPNDIVGRNVWNLVQDGANAWVADQEAQGVSDEEIADRLAQYDQLDRYDFDNDGDFAEPDGYIDRFQIVHAGGDEADGDPIYGEDAIWSHRWYAFGTNIGRTGPAENMAGGTEIGDTGIWVGDYTMQAENGGLSTVAHEYGHDLGLPDDYDTAGGSNGIEWWSLMAQSRLSGEGEPIGTRAGDLGAWEKLQLGWLDYETVVAGQKRRLVLGPQEYNTADAQGVVVVLPDKQVTTPLGEPASGDRQWWSGKADNLSSTLTTDVDLTGASTATLAMQARWDIEAGYDYLYAEASTDGGDTWTTLAGTVGGTPFDDESGAPGLSGNQPTYTDVEIPLDAYAGDEVQLRFLYRTDGGVSELGFFADDITVTADGETVLADGAEDPAASPFVADGFSSVGSELSTAYDNYYVAGQRSYVSYDQYLETGPYNFGFPDRPDFVEHFPYQEGLLVTYWDTSQADNNVSRHPGEGRNLVVDAHPRPMYNLEGQAWRSRIQVYDAPFSTQKADSFTLHINGKPSYVRGQQAARVFDDTKKYFYEEFPANGVKLPGAGVKMRVLTDDGTSMRVRIS
ncbi:immune inhibitor A domain-containing protein [Pseudokineococcus basanitobsidens]|uniref:Immune inhibitor A domain-containing protein n=1 Tax=Pseudokineococcus basanitobsidens TaxID=1926649 RepID=A0ABU8RML4_9ACTN